MSSIDELKQWEEDLQELSTEKAKLEGKYEQSMADLKKLGYSSIEEAKTAYDQLLAEKKEAETEAESLLKSLKEKYKDFIQEG